MRFLLAAVLLLLLRGVGWTLATALGAVQDPIGCPLKRQGTGGNPARVALRRHAEAKACRKTGAGDESNSWSEMAQINLQAVHGLQRIGLLVDEDEEQLVFHLEQTPLAPPPLWRWRTLPSQVLSGG